MSSDKKRGLEIEELCVDDLRDAKGKSVHPISYTEGLSGSFKGAENGSTTAQVTAGTASSKPAAPRPL